MRTRIRFPLAVLLLLVALRPAVAAEAEPAPVWSPDAKLAGYTVQMALAGLLAKDSMDRLIAKSGEASRNTQLFLDRKWSFQMGLILGQMQEAANLLADTPLPGPEFSAFAKLAKEIGTELKAIVRDLSTGVEELDQQAVARATGRFERIAKLGGGQGHVWDEAVAAYEAAHGLPAAPAPEK